MTEEQHRHANSSTAARRRVALSYRERCCRWHRCRGPLQAERASRRYCSTRCRIAAFRARHGAARLGQCRVELVDRHEARTLIKRHELLGTCGNAATWYGLRDPDGKLWSLVGFGHGPHAAGGVVLERGYTRRRALHNAASFLISRALRLGGWSRVRAYSDPRFGEQGLVYKAAGFVRCPPSKHGDPCRYALVDGGRVMSDRAIYRRHGSHAAARAAGAEIIRLPARVAWEWQAVASP